jgi:hypothetical protein
MPQQHLQAAPSPSASTGEPQLWLIPSDQVDNVWSLAASHIRKAIARSDDLISTEDHFAACVNGSRQLWLIWDGTCRAAIVTEIIRGVCFIWALGGDGMKGWLHLHHRLEQWARDQGCRSMQMWGRPGWTRALDAFGYRRTLVVMNKELAP